MHHSVHWHERRFHVPREALGIGYDEWATKTLQALENKSTKSEAQEDQGSAPDILEVAVGIILIITLGVYLSIACQTTDQPEPRSLDEIMSQSLKP